MVAQILDTGSRSTDFDVLPTALLVKGTIFHVRVIYVV